MTHVLKQVSEQREKSSVPVTAAENCSVSLRAAWLQDPAWLIRSSGSVFGTAAETLTLQVQVVCKLLCRDLGAPQERLMPFSTSG